MKEKAESVNLYNRFFNHTLGFFKNIQARSQRRLAEFNYVFSFFKKPLGGVVKLKNKVSHYDKSNML